MKNFSKFQFYLVVHTGNMRQLVVVRRICCCSQFMIFPLHLLGPAIGFSADPSSSKGKNHELRTTTNSFNYNQISPITCGCTLLLYVQYSKHLNNSSSQDLNSSVFLGEKNLKLKSVRNEFFNANPLGHKYINSRIS